MNLQPLAAPQRIKTGLGPASPPSMVRIPQS